jgi:hypothetical protein
MVLPWIQDDARLHNLNSRWEGHFIVHKLNKTFWFSFAYRPALSNLHISCWGTKFLEYWTSMSVSFLINWGHLLLVPGGWYFQYNSVLLVHDWYYVQVCSRGLAPILPVTNSCSRLVSWVTKGALRSYF